MDVQLDEEQLRLQASARRFLDAECPMGLVREHADAASLRPDPDGAVQVPVWQKLWDDMAELGWTGLVIPEAYGGAGLDWVDLCVLLEEMGRALLPAPFFSAIVLGGSAIARAGSSEQQRELLPQIASGELRLSLAQLEPAGDWNPSAVRLRAESTRDGYSLRGRKLFVPDADSAHALIVAACSDAGRSLYLVPTDAPGLSLRRIDYLDPSRAVFEIDFEDVPVAADAALGEPGTADALLAEIHDFARVALSAEMCGGAQHVLELSVAHAKTREQFGRPIGSFQAIAHKCADMFVKVESARSAAYYAAWALTAGSADAHVSACMAKAYCAEAYTKVAGDGIQIHGGLGFTWEQDLHFFYKRAKACEVSLGGVSWTRELAAQDWIDRPTDRSRDSI